MSNQSIKNSLMSTQEGVELAKDILNRFDEGGRTCEGIKTFTHRNKNRIELKKVIYNPSEWIFEWLWDFNFIEPICKNKAPQTRTTFRITTDIDEALARLEELTTKQD
ncbi:hypothetical protein NVP1201B_69 [Vibrio phage 1.201.B._10N.286.55.F1]|nr:hypothetical protein NVP1201B_69 [Vibrio phage 1.201.B._10N.286.55.F1]